MILWLILLWLEIVLKLLLSFYLVSFLLEHKNKVSRLLCTFTFELVALSSVCLLIQHTGLTALRLAYQLNNEPLRRILAEAPFDVAILHLWLRQALFWYASSIQGIFFTSSVTCFIFLCDSFHLCCRFFPHVFFHVFVVIMMWKSSRKPSSRSTLAFKLILPILLRCPLTLPLWFWMMWKWLKLVVFFLWLTNVIAKLQPPSVVAPSTPCVRHKLFC